MNPIIVEGMGYRAPSAVQTALQNADGKDLRTLGTYNNA